MPLANTSPPPPLPLVPSTTSSSSASSSRSRWLMSGGLVFAAGCVGYYCYYRYYCSRQQRPPGQPPSGGQSSSAHSHYHTAAHSRHPVVLFPQPDHSPTATTTQPPHVVPASLSSTSTRHIAAQPALTPLTSLTALAAQADPFAFLRDSNTAATQPAPSLQSEVRVEVWHCSCPGKALLTGGYLVLERQYCGLIVALSARFHAIVVPCSHPSILQAIDTPSPSPSPSHSHSHSEPHSLSPHSAAATQTDVSDGAVTAVFLLHAPQRSAGLVEYRMRVVVDGGAGGATGGVTDIGRYPADSEANPFVLCGLFYTLHFLSAVLPPPLLRFKLSCPILLHVSGERQFYSAAPLSDSQPRSLDGKTGLGSSATLVSSLVGALCHYFQLIDDSDKSAQLVLHSSLLPHYSSSTVSSLSSGLNRSVRSRPLSSLDASFTVVGHDLSTFPTSSSASLPVISTLSLPRPDRLSICHRLSQVAHCAAQGKVGSGFDVSAAYFGSQVYRRFSPQCIADVVPASVDQLLSTDRSALVRCILPDMQHHYHQPADSSGSGGDLPSSTAVSLSLPAPLSAPTSPSSAISPDSTSPSSSYSSLSELDRTPSPITPPACSLCSALSSRQQWNEKVVSLRLPSFLTVLLADVQGGAKTPGMVQKVLQWRAADSSRERSEQLYQAMAVEMTRVEHVISELASQERDSHVSYCAAVEELLAHLDSMSPDDWAGLLSTGTSSGSSGIGVSRVSEWLLRQLVQLRLSFAQIRLLYRSIDSGSGAGIEPATQTQLCDATMEVKGVLAAGVPGAGGEDAIFIFAVQHPQLTAALEAKWQQLSQQRAAVGGAGNRAISRLDVQQATEGITFDADSRLSIDKLRLPHRPAQ